MLDDMMRLAECNSAEVNGTYYIWTMPTPSRGGSFHPYTTHTELGLEACELNGELCEGKQDREII